MLGIRGWGLDMGRVAVYPEHVPQSLRLLCHLPCFDFVYHTIQDLHVSVIKRKLMMVMMLGVWSLMLGFGV